MSHQQLLLDWNLCSLQPPLDVHHVAPNNNLGVSEELLLAERDHYPQIFDFVLAATPEIE